jgi:hypothetical protein
MTRSIALLLLACALCFCCVTLAQDCTRYCYSGTLDFGAPLPPASFELAYIPCSNTVSGQIEQRPFTAFSCQDNYGGTEGLMRMQTETAPDALPHYSLQWLYLSATENCTSASLFVNEFGGSDTFVNASYTYTAVGAEYTASSDSVGLNEMQSVCGTDCAAQCFSFDVLTSGLVAGDSSPCGALNTTQCTMTVHFTLTPCSGLISDFDVEVHPTGADSNVDGTLLSAYDPLQLASPELRCLDGGVLQFSAGGVYLLWLPTLLPCAQLMNNVGALAEMPLEQVAVVLGSELWESAEQQAAETALAFAECDDGGQVHSDVFPPTYYVFPAHKPVKPRVTCSAPIAGDFCCTVFGVENENFYPVYIPVAAKQNYFTPKPINRGQQLLIAANFTNDYYLTVVWPCKKYELNVLTWTLRHSAKLGNTDWTIAEVDAGTLLPQNTERTWMRQARAIRVRDDCSNAIIEELCLQAMRK